MNKIVSAIRIAILITLGAFGIILFIGEEVDQDFLQWFIHVIIDKAIAFGALYLMVKLYKHWSKTDQWIIAYNKWNDKALEELNDDV